MTTPLLAIKLLAGVTLAGGSALGITFVATTFSKNASQLAALSKVIVVKTSSTITSASVSSGKTSNNYKCKLPSTSSPTYACKITKLPLEKKWADITTIKSPPETPNLTITDLTTTTNYFKLEVDASLYAEVNFDDKKVIDIVEETATSNKISSFDVLFKIDGTTADYKSATHALTKAPAIAVSDLGDSTNGSYCSLSTSATVSDTITATQCDLLAFGAATDKYSSATYAHATTTLTSLEANKYYLLKWKPENTNLAKATFTGKTHAYVAKAASITSSSTKATLTEVLPVIIDGTSSAAIAFILSSST